MILLNKINILNGRIIPSFTKKLLVFLSRNNKKNYEEKKKIIKKITDKKNIFNNIKNMHIFLRENIKKTINNNHFDISLAGTGGDKKNIINITTISSIFLGILKYKIFKINSSHYTGNMGSSEFIRILFGKNFFESKKKNKFVRKNLKVFFANYRMILKYKLPNLKKIRKEYGKPTLFNYSFSSFLPFNTDLFLLGTNNIISINFYKKINFNSKKTIIISSYDNTDEITTTSKFKMYYRNIKKEYIFVFDPKKNGFPFVKGTLKNGKKDVKYMFEKIIKKNSLKSQNILFNISIIICFKTGINILKIYKKIKSIKKTSFFLKKYKKIFNKYVI
ncbi:hypothetical protein ACWNX6_00225 [Candidatus Vidania fulgoroideorum]